MLDTKETRRETVIAEKDLLESLKEYLETITEEFFESIPDETFWDLLEGLDSYSGCLDCDRWYPMDELDELLWGMSPHDILSECKDIDVYDDYFRCGVYGWESGDREYDSSYRDIDTYNEMMECLKFSDLEYYVDNDTTVRIHALRELMNKIDNLKSDLDTELQAINEALMKEATASEYEETVTE